MNGNGKQAGLGQIGVYYDQLVVYRFIELNAGLGQYNAKSTRR